MVQLEDNCLEDKEGVGKTALWTFGVLCYNCYNLTTKKETIK